jgi:hypothetical protein
MAWVSNKRMKLKGLEIILWDEGYSLVPSLWSMADERMVTSPSRRLENALIHRALPGSHRRHSSPRVEHIPTASSTLGDTPTLPRACRLSSTSPEI